MLSCFSCHTQAADPADQVEAAVRYIRSNIEEDLHRSDIAAAVHLNPNYLSGLFKSRMGGVLEGVYRRTKNANSAAPAEDDQLAYQHCIRQGGIFEFFLFFTGL